MPIKTSILPKAASNSTYVWILQMGKNFKVSYIIVVSDKNDVFRILVPFMLFMQDYNGILCMAE